MVAFRGSKPAGGIIMLFRWRKKSSIIILNARAGSQEAHKVISTKLQHYFILPCLAGSLILPATVSSALAQAHPPTLKGEARKYEKNVKIKGRLLKGKALLDAHRQFNLDVATFAAHTRIYNLHINEARKFLRGYQAGKEDCNKMKKEVELSTSQFNIRASSVKPPSSCLQV
jgi:hypothetical protein